MPTLHAADRKKVEKLRRLVDDLRFGKQYSITCLTSIKSLCKAPTLACQFTAHLARLAAERLAHQKRPSYVAQAQWDEFLRLAAEGMQAIEHQSPKPQLRDVWRRVRESQNQIEHQRWADVRIIQSGELLQIELALQCTVETGAAPQVAYHAARNHAEKYDARYGSGLLPQSASRLQEIVDFFDALQQLDNQAETQ